MIANKNRVKVWILSTVAVLMSSIYEFFTDQDDFVVGIFLSIFMLMSAYLITQKNQKWGSWMWIALFCIPRIANVLFSIGSEFSSLSGVRCIITFALCLPASRYILQWSYPIWATNKNMSLRFWKNWIYVEELAVICGSAFFLSIIRNSIYKSIPIHLIFLPILGIIALYKRLKKRCFADLGIDPSVNVQPKIETN